MMSHQYVEVVVGGTSDCQVSSYFRGRPKDHLLVRIAVSC